MRTTIALLLVGLCAFAIAGPVKVDQTGVQYRVADTAFLHKQRDILRLFKYVFQTNYYKDQAQIAQSYKIEEHLDQYAHPKAIKEFMYYYKEGFLPRGEVFSIFYEEHRQQAVALFHVLYYAKSYDIFYKTACWAREYVNEGMFVYAMNVAVLHRHDTQGMVLPPIYEVYPYFFVNSEVIDKAYEYKMKYGFNYQGNDKQQKYYVPANYSGWYLNANPEQYDLSYFTEDIGLNAFYYYYNLDYPFWMGGEEYGLKQDRRGELYYFVHQQILARYYLERLSNGYGNIPVYDWEEPIQTGYVPSMRYPNGLQFPVRHAYAHLVYNPHNQEYTFNAEDNIFLIQEIQDYERRIRDAIDSGYVITEDGQKINLYEQKGFDLLGKIIESNPDSPNNRFYGYLQVIAHQVLGYSTHPIHEYMVNPSALEHFETALRDPVFYQFYKRITYYFLQYKSNLPHYTYTQLNYPGVTVEDVTVDKLVTYFDKFDFEITNALYVQQQEYESDDFQVWARQYRLNHLPYTLKIQVNSNQATDVVVRVFLGPKYDEQGRELPLNENRVNFVELDKFVYTLKAGKTVIERNSREGETVKDRTTYRALYENVMAALKGQKEFHLDMTEAHNGFPNRLVLPKGKQAGQVYQFYVYVSPYKTSYEKSTYDSVVSAGVGSGSRYVDDLPFGYPLDRQIKYEQNFYVPNSYFKDVVIYHKTQGVHQGKITYQHGEMIYGQNGHMYGQDEQIYGQHGQDEQIYGQNGQVYGKNGQFYGKYRQTYTQNGQVYGQNEQIYGQNGQDEQIYGQGEQIYGQNGQDEQIYGQNEKIYGQNKQMYGQDEQTYGQDQQSYGQNKHFYGQDEQTHSQDQQTYGQDEQTYGQDEQTYGQDEQIYGQDEQIYSQDKQQYENTYSQNGDETYQQGEETYPQGEKTYPQGKGKTYYQGTKSYSQGKMPYQQGEMTYQYQGQYSQGGHRHGGHHQGGHHQDEHHQKF